MAAPALTAATSCPACGGVAARVAAEPADYEYQVEPPRPLRYVECAACGCEWLDPRPTDAELMQFYPPGYHAYNDDHGAVAAALVAMRGWLRRRYYRRLLPPQGGRLFDVGAGDCRHFGELARCPGLSFAGVEINPAMAERARAAGYDVETGTLEQLDLARHRGRYRIVSMNHVLEHVLDPREVIQRCWALLEPGGWVVGQLPTKSSWEHRVFGARWAGYHFPRHTQLLRRDGLVRLLAGAGFVRTRLWSTPHGQIALSLQNSAVAAGLPTRLQFGRAPFFGVLLLLCLPLEIIQSLCNRSGVIDFEAQRPDMTRHSS